MNQETESLRELVERVSRLVNSEQWDDLTALDERGRRIVESATARVRETGKDGAVVRPLIERLQALYEQARSCAEAERDQAQRELSETARTQRAAQAYLDNQ